MGFLIDVCVGREVEREVCVRLPELDIRCVRDIDPRMFDEDIIKLGLSEKRVVITADKDFGELAYRLGMTHEGVLLLRIDDLTVAERIDVIVKLLEQHRDSLPGHFCVYHNGLLRIR